MDLAELAARLFAWGPKTFLIARVSIRSFEGSAHVSLAVPNRAPLRTLSLRLRLPHGNRISSVALDGRPFRRFDPETETIDLSGRAGRLDLVVGFGKR